MLLTILLQLVITYIPIFHSIIKTQTLSVIGCSGVCTTSSLVFFSVEIEKAVSSKRRKNSFFLNDHENKKPDTSN